MHRKTSALESLFNKVTGPLARKLMYQNRAIEAQEKYKKLVQLTATPWTGVTDITEVSLEFNFDTTLHLIPASLLKQKVISWVTEIATFRFKSTPCKNIEIDWFVVVTQILLIRASFLVSK